MCQLTLAQVMENKEAWTYDHPQHKKIAVNIKENLSAIVTDYLSETVMDNLENRRFMNPFDSLRKNKECYFYIIISSDGQEIPIFLLKSDKPENLLLTTCNQTNWPTLNIK